MCSIIGYLGLSPAAPIIVKGLKRMEYRGYDSVGVATFSNNHILVRKGVGKVLDVNKIVRLDELSGVVGIGHTRWATHGEVTDTNAHPHPSSSGEIAIVHNGIIENHEELKKDLQQKGYTFKSQTDSEVIANLLQYHHDKVKEIKKAVLETVSALKGNYAFVAVFEDGTLAAARLHEPLIIGIGKDGYFISSDVLGFVESTDEVIYLDNKEFVIINSSGIKIFDFDSKPVEHQITKVSKEFADVYKGEYAHFTLKEISKNAGSKIISVVNIMTSSLVQISSISIGLNCGPEIGVAATKSFTAQLAVLYKIVDKICGGCISLDLSKVSESISKILSDHSGIQEIAKKLKDVSDIYVLGRGIHYPIASEASLKLKELTYIHAEGLPGGELKHGPLALMDTNTFVIMINPNDSTYFDTLTSAREIKARGAKVIGISDKQSDIYDYWIEIPQVDESVYPFIEIVPVQLLAYYAALEKDTDPDYPRNLAKSVTVK